MRAVALAGFLLAAAGWAQMPNACQEKCLSRDCSGSCSDDRCTKRCSAQIQSCIESCPKTATNEKPPSFKGNCPGPNGRMIPCDQYVGHGPDQNALTERQAKGRPKKKEKENFPHEMPTADNYKELYEKNKKPSPQSPPPAQP